MEGLTGAGGQPNANRVPREVSGHCQITLPLLLLAAEGMAPGHGLSHDRCHGNSLSPGLGYALAIAWHCSLPTTLATDIDSDVALPMALGINPNPNN